MLTRLREPETCPNGHVRLARIIDSRVSPASSAAPGYRRRRHQCTVCAERWTSYQSLVNPRRIRFTYKPVVVQVSPT